MQIGGTGGFDIQSMMSNMKNQAFQRGDADKSGGISQAEFADMGKNSPLSGVISSSELSTADAFAQIDTDGDGNITQSEMNAFQPQGGAFSAGMSSDMMSSLLALQEQSGGEANSLLSLLNSESSESGGSSEDDLLNSLFDVLDQNSQDDQDE